MKSTGHGRRLTLAKRKGDRKPTIREMIKAAADIAAAEIQCNDYTEPTPATPPEKTMLEKALVRAKRTPDELARLDNVYTRFEITAAQVEACPNISDAFDDIGGVVAVIEYLRSSDDGGAKELLRYWDMYKDSEDSAKSIIPFEAYCVAAKMTKKKLMQVVMGEVCEQSDVASTLLAAAAHPKIVQKTISVAQSDAFGAGDARKILHQHRGFLPTPKTQQVNIHGNLNQDNRQDNRQTANISLLELDKANERISRAVDRFNEARVIKESESEPEYIDVEGPDVPE